MSFKIEDLSSTEKKALFDIDAKEVAKSFNGVVGDSEIKLERLKCNYLSSETI